MAHHTTRTIALLTAIWVTLYPTRGFGQVPTKQELKTQETVWVTTSDGQITQGRFHGWADSTFEWETSTGLVVRTPLEQIVRIEAPDPIRDGILRGSLIGAAAGGTFGLLLGIGLSCSTNCGPDYSRTKDILGGVFATAVMGAGGGAALGAAMDAMIHRRRLVYAQSAASTRIMLTPVLGRGSLGAAATIEW